MTNINLSNWKPTRKPSMKGKVANRRFDGRVCLLPCGEGTEPQAKRMRGIFCLNSDYFPFICHLRDIFPTKGKTLKISQMDLQKMQWNCILPKVLLNFFQKIFMVWGETPRSFPFFHTVFTFQSYPTQSHNLISKLKREY